MHLIAQAVDRLFQWRDLHDLVMTFVYSGVGAIVFALFLLCLLRWAPFPVIKEIEEDQNVALAILIAAVLIGLSIIIAAAVHG